MNVFIIAEAGVNHNGSLEIAKKLIDAAKEAGADCIKFQTFRAENLVTKYANQAEYQEKNIGEPDTQLNMLKKLELTYSEFEEIKNYCYKSEIEFMSTAFDLESVDFLEKLKMKTWKIPSGEITNLPYLVKIARLKKPVILSTGMSTLSEVEVAISVLKGYGVNDLTVLHCTTDYPTRFSEVNLNAMLTMKKMFDIKIGYSDHTIGISIPIAAVALGAKVIEKHFTLDRNMVGPDHKASLEPAELKQMVESIRNIEVALGDGNKIVTVSEHKNIVIARKSIVAKKKIYSGDEFTEENLTTKRPGSGISPMMWFEVIGKRASRDFEIDELIKIGVE